MIIPPPSRVSGVRNHGIPPHVGMGTLCRLIKRLARRSDTLRVLLRRGDRDFAFPFRDLQSGGFSGASTVISASDLPWYFVFR